MEDNNRYKKEENLARALVRHRLWKIILLFLPLYRLAKMIYHLSLLVYRIVSKADGITKYPVRNNVSHKEKSDHVRAS
jgi:hypothetical protein